LRPGYERLFTVVLDASSSALTTAFFRGGGCRFGPIDFCIACQNSSSGSSTRELGNSLRTASNSSLYGSTFPPWRAVDQRLELLELIVADRRVQQLSAAELLLLRTYLRMAPNTCSRSRS